MMQDSVESTEQAEALVNTLQIEGTSLSDTNLTSLSTSDLEQLADLQAELASINEADVVTSVEGIQVKQMLDGDIVETDIGSEEVVIETEELPQCESPDEILPDIKGHNESSVDSNSTDDVESKLHVEPIIKIEPKEAPPPPLRPLTIAPKPVKIVPQMSLKTAAVMNQGHQQIVLIQSPGGAGNASGAGTVNIGGQQIKLVSAQGQPVTIPNMQNVQLTKVSTAGGVVTSVSGGTNSQIVQLRTVPSSKNNCASGTGNTGINSGNNNSSVGGGTNNNSNIVLKNTSVVKKIQQTSGGGAGVTAGTTAAGKNILAKVVVGGQQQVVQLNTGSTNAAGTAVTTVAGGGNQIKLVTTALGSPATSIGTGGLPANAKTITLAQAQQMGLIAGGKVQQIIATQPTKQTVLVNKQQLGTKTIKVVPHQVTKSPTKILPAPVQSTLSGGAGGKLSGKGGTVSGGGVQRFIIKQGNQLKTVTATTSSGSSPVNQIIRLPAGQTLNTTTAAAAGQIHQINVPGKGVQYIRFMPATAATASTTQTTTGTTIIQQAKTKSSIQQQQQQQVVPVASIAVNHRPGTLNKIVAATTGSTQNVIKVIPLSSSGNSATTQTRPVAPKPVTTQRVLIPANSGSGSSSSATGQQQLLPATAATAAAAAGGNVSQIVMLPAQYVQQITQQNQTATVSGNTTANNNVNANTVTAATIRQQQQTINTGKTTIISPNAKVAAQQQLKQLKLSPVIGGRQTISDLKLSPSTSSVSNNNNNSGNSSMLDITVPSSPTPLDNNINLSSGNGNSNYSRTLEPNGIRPRKPCNCTKSLCLKLYCDCFANGEFCHLCNCMNCYNNLEHEEERSRAIRNCLERNPNAFRPKIGKGKDAGEMSVRKHTKGCNCKRSGCLKNYCECYEAKIACSSNCKCIGCRNIEDTMDKKNARTSLALNSATGGSLMASPDSNSQLQVVPTGLKIKQNTLTDNDATIFRPMISNITNKFPSTFITNDVIDATAQCLIAQGDDAQRNMVSDEEACRMILDEIGRCFIQIIECSKNAANTG